MVRPVVGVGIGSRLFGLVIWRGSRYGKNVPDIRNLAVHDGFLYWKEEVKRERKILTVATFSAVHDDDWSTTR